MFLVTVAFCVGAFFLFRAVVLWYWRVNEILETLKSIDQKLAIQASRSPVGVTEQLQLSWLQSINQKLGILTDGKPVVPKGDPADLKKAPTDPMEYAPKS